MSHFLLTVHRPGTLLIPAVSGARHPLEARGAAEAAERADDLIFETYPKTGKATFRLFDTSGLIATRRGDGDWCRETEAEDAEPAPADFASIRAAVQRGQGIGAKRPR